MDAARLPAHVVERLATVGYRVIPPALRDKVDRWDELDKGDMAAAENDLDLMAAALAR